MAFETLPSNVLREFVKWSQDFSKSCHLLSKTIYLATKEQKLERFKNVPLKKSDYTSYIKQQTHPFGCVSYAQYSFLTCKLWATSTRPLTPTQSFDIKGTLYGDNKSMSLSTVKSDVTYTDRFCFNRSSRYFVGKSFNRKLCKDEMLGNFFELYEGKNEFMDCKEIPISYFLDDTTYFDSFTYFKIISLRKIFSLVLCRTVTCQYFDSCLQKFNIPVQRFIWTYVNYLILGLDSIHNQFSCSGKLDSSVSEQMENKVREAINLLV